MADKTKILFAGDPHGNFTPLIQAVNTCHPDAVVLLGDYELKKPLESYLHSILDKTEVWWIPGNHDYDSTLHYENLFFSALSDFTLHLTVKDVAGVRIAGLGGIFLGRIWYPPQVPKWKSQQHFFSDENAPSKTSRLYLKYKSAIWHDEWENLKALKADILVTHEAPKSHRYGFMAIDELAEAMGVTKIFHGHLHEHYSAKIRKGIQVFGVGDAMVSDLVGNVV